MIAFPPTMLGVFAKYWEAGSVKTRLAADLGDAAAAGLARAFLEATLRRLGGLAAHQEVCFWPAEQEAEFRTAVSSAWHLSPQREGSLGERMEAFLDRAFAGGADRVVLIGSDTPSLPRNYVTQALDELTRAAVVLGPARDGGYYLIGARPPTPSIFRGVDWGTPLVWRQTLSALHQSGLRAGDGYRCLPEWSDVDTLGDLRELRQELAGKPDEEEPLARLAAAIDQALGQSLQDETRVF